MSTGAMIALGAVLVVVVLVAAVMGLAAGAQKSIDKNFPL